MEEENMEYTEAVLSGNATKIKALCKRDNISIPENEEAFWAGIHMTICRLTRDVAEKYNKSKDWLERHNYSVPTESLSKK